LIPDEFDLNVYSANELQYAWCGGKMLAESPDFTNLVVTKKLYEEFGHNICEKHFHTTSK
jgi:actin-related protein